MLFALLVLAVAIAVAGLTTGFLFTPQTKPPDLPPGVTAAEWVPLAENSGVLLTQNRRFFGTPNDMHGTLFVKVANVWHRLYFDPAPVTAMPTY
jgi:hypothetical protein